MIYRENHFFTTSNGIVEIFEVVGNKYLVLMPNGRFCGGELQCYTEEEFDDLIRGRINE